MSNRPLRSRLSDLHVGGMGSLVVANLLSPALAIAVAPVLARTLGQTGRGDYAAILSAYVLAGILGTLGLQDGLTHFIAQRGWTARQARRVILVTACPLAALCALVLSALASSLYVEDDTRRLFLVLLPNVALQVGQNLYLGLLTGFRDRVGQIWIRVAPVVTRTVLLLVLAIAGALNLPSALWVTLASPLIVAVLPLYRLRSAPRRSYAPVVRTSRRTESSRSPGVRPLLVFSLATLPGLFATLATSRLDQAIGLPLMGAAQLGQYAVAVTVAELPLVLAAVGRSLLLGVPAGPAGGRERRQIFIVTLTGLVLVDAVLACLVPLLIPFIFGQDYRRAVVPCLVLLLATLLVGVNNSLSALALGHGRAAGQSIALIVGAVANVVALIALASDGAVGAAWASVIGYGVSTATLGVLVQRLNGTATVR